LGYGLRRALREPPLSDLGDDRMIFRTSCPSLGGKNSEHQRQKNPAFRKRKSVAHHTLSMQATIIFDSTARL
jgi:hypothetical protein